MISEEKIYRTAMYLRLSKGDGDVDGLDKAESNTITNQRALCGSFIERQPDLQLAGTYIDDGYTGTNFDRPEMKRMMADVDAGRIDCIVVKDLSRFGRERIETGTYISKTFREKGVRFIAINDHYDTLTADGSETHIVMPIKALTNDSFSRDISTKVRSSQRVKREKGAFIGAFAVYGYLKDPADNNHLVPDEYAAGVVRDIFAKRIGGMSANAIASELNDAGVLSPAEYKQHLGQHYCSGFQGANASRWSAQTVLRILKNEVYVGVLEQGKRSKVSYKVKKEIHKPKSEWVRVEGTHDPIIDRAAFDTVQVLLGRDTICPAGSKEPYLYAGLLYCGDCGKSMVRRVNTYKDGHTVVNYICSDYNRNGRCGRNPIPEEELTALILTCLRQWIDVLIDAKELSSHLMELRPDYDSVLQHDEQIALLRAELTRYNALKSSLYDDLKDGVLSEAQFNRYREEYTSRAAQTQKAIDRQEKIIRSILEKGIAGGLELDEMRRKLNVEQLDRVLLVTLIDRILIYRNGDVRVILNLHEEVCRLKSVMAAADPDSEERKAV